MFLVFDRVAMRSWEIQSLRSAPPATLGLARRLGTRTRQRPIATAAFQVKEAEILIERISAGFKAEKLLDKITTVIAGQTTVEPDVLDKGLKAITTGEDPDSWEELRSGLIDSASNLWTASLDTVTHFNPFDFGNWIGTLLEDFAERFAAWELSSLVALGERWLIWTPLVVLPMAWQMSRNSNKNVEAQDIKGVIISPAVKEKQERVTKEIERMKLRSLLVQEVAATEASTGSIQAIVKQLQTLGSMVDEDAAMDNIEGHWKLIYTSEEPNSISRLPGFEMSQLEQEISRHVNDNTLNTHNSALLRVGGVGSLRVGIKGVWNKSNEIIEFGEITAGIVEVFESPISWDVPRMVLALPVPQPQQWKLLYMDDELRINQGTNTLLYIFLKKVDTECNT